MKISKTAWTVAGAVLIAGAGISTSTAVLTAHGATASGQPVWQHVTADFESDTRIQQVPAGARLNVVCFSVSPMYPVKGNPDWYVVKYAGRMGYVSAVDLQRIAATIPTVPDCSRMSPSARAV